jgi:hypothetical protein
MKNTLYFITVLCALFLTGLKARSQTSLSAGDIAIVGYNAEGPNDNFSFVLLTNVSAGTSIIFTDLGWCTDGTGFQKGNPAGCTGGTGSYGAKTDGAITWTSSTALPCGTEIRVYCQNSLSASTGGVTGLQATVNVPSDYISLATGGDHLFAIQGSLASPTFITAMSMNVGPFGAWDPVVNTCDFSSVLSALPAALNASNSFAGFATEVDNAKYKCSVMSSNSPANLRTAIFNSSNWDVDDGAEVALPLNCPFSCNSCIAPAVTSHQPNRTLCVGGSTTLPITATGTGLTYQWQVNTGSGYNNVPNAAPYSNITTSTLTISSVTGSMSGYLYRCVVTGTCGTANSNQSTLTVDVVAGTSAVSPVSCNGGSNGAAAVTVTSGIGPFSYSWSPGGSTSSTASGLSANTYTCTITDNLTCTGTVQAIITEPAQPVSAAVTTVNNVTCPGGTNGNMTVTPSGGTPGYTYLWSTGATTATIFGLTAGTYNVTVRDSKNCPTTSSATVTAPPAFVTSSSTTPVSCNGGGNGTATVTVSSGGQAPYTYQWSAAAGSQTTQTATGLSAGSYSVTVRDNNLCPTTVTGIVVGQPSVLNAGTTPKDITCFGYNNGMAAVTPTGGNGGYSYLWTNGATSQVVTGLAPGPISVTITDFKGCTVTKNFTINQPTDFTIGTSQTAILCSGGTGSATVSVSGATSPYSYSWSPSGGTNATATGLTANTYSVIIEDFNGCQATRSFTLTAPPALTGTISKTDVNCFGGNNGTATVSITGGTGAYSYSWSPSGGTGVTASGLVAGTYTCTITDANNCQITRTATVGQPAVALSGSTVVTNVACFSGSTGAINLTPAGGTFPYTYNWVGGITTEDRTLLAAGTYSVTITDANGCTATASATVTQPAAALSGTTVVTNAACFGTNTGAINLTPTGGTFPYTYNWGGGITTEDRTLLAAGNYSVTITDANGCTTPVSASVTEPSALAGLTLSSSTNVSCFGGSNGSASVTAATGGTGTITYDWTPGTPTGDGTTSITGLLAGTYTVTATDNNGCTRSLPVTITQPPALGGLTLVSSTNVSCFGGSNGSASVTAATGGTGTITYDWTPGTPTGDGTTSISGLTQGTYTVTATDNNGCTKSLPVTITQPTALAGLTLVSSTNVSCFGGSNGSASVTAATGGTGTITYDWTPGTPTGEGTTSISGLTQGTYTVTATDNNGCTKSLAVPITQPDPLAATPSQNNLTCNGVPTGSATVAVTGGTGAYTYSWSPTGGTSATASGLAAGAYTVTIRDVNLCETTDSFIITEPALAESSLAATACDSYTLNGTTYTTSGTYTQVLNNAAGCDSTITLNLTVKYATVSSMSVTTCDSYTLNGTTYTTSGTYTQVLNNVAGCDSTITLNLTLKYATVASMNATACNSYTLNGTTYTTSGTYVQTLTNAVGCDSTLTLNLTVKYATVASMNATACNSYTLNGTTYTTSGTYVQTLTNSAGCDSTLTLNLTVNYASAHSFAATACNSYTLNGTTYTTSGTYIQTLPNASGCDSTLTLNLTLKYATASSMSATACDSYTLNGTTYTTSGIYTQVIPNAVGCDSTITLDLTINYSTSYTLTATGCDSYTLNGQTYTASGTYTQVLTNQVGCDWNFTLVLTINHSTATSLTQVACGNYTLNGQTYTASGVYTQTFENAAGCDSIVTLNLTIKQPTGSSLTETACGSFTLNNQTYNTSGTYTQTFVNSVGCDSIVTLHLTIKTVNVNVETNGFVIASEANNATYQWLDCSNFTPISGATSQSFTVTANGDYAVVVTQNGCTDTSACVPVYGVSITENDIKNIDVRVYPNPTLDYVYIQTDGVIQTIDVMDISGKKYQPYFSVGKLDLTSMPSGIYLVRVTLNNGQQALTRVIKM